MYLKGMFSSGQFILERSDNRTFKFVAYNPLLQFYFALLFEFYLKGEITIAVEYFE